MNRIIRCDQCDCANGESGATDVRDRRDLGVLCAECYHETRIELERDLADERAFTA